MTMENPDREKSASAGMTVARFAALAEAYGADFDRWPDAERHPAIALAGRSAEARALLADAHETDLLLWHLDAPPEPPAALGERIAGLRPGNPPAAPRPAPALRPLAAPPAAAATRGSAGRAAAFAMAAAAGLCFGLLAAPPGTGGGGLGLIEAALIVGEAPSVIAANLVEAD